MARIIGALLAVLSALVVSAPAAAQPSTNSNECNDVLQGGASGGLTKTFVSATPTTPGHFALVYDVTTPRGAGTYDKLRDCAFVDLDDDGELDDGEPLFRVEIKPVIFAGDTYRLTIEVEAATGDRVCDRAALSGGTAESFTDKSNLDCQVLGGPPPVIPEVPAAVALPLMAMGLLGAAALVVRRRAAIAG